MNCRMCGAELKDEAVICFLCGTFVHPLIDRDRLRERRRRALNRGRNLLMFGDFREEENSSWNTQQPGPDGRIPYGSGPVGGRGPEAQAYRSTFSNLSLILGIAGFFTLIIPYISLPIGIMAILFGVLGLRKMEFYRTRAIVGIVFGSCLVLIGGTLIICVSALLPYQDDLIRIWGEYMQQLR